MTPEQITVSFAGRSVEDAAPQAKSIYGQYGCFLAKGLFDPSEFDATKNDLNTLVDAAYRRLGRARPFNGRFDDGVTDLAKTDRRLVGHIYDACKRLLPVHELSVDNRLIKISKILMHTDIAAASDIKALRFDLPNEDKYLFGWHQDYPYVMDSLDGVVFWIPIQDVDETNGCLVIAPGSHLGGLRKLAVIDPGNDSNNKQKVLEIADQAELARLPKMKVGTKLGDVLVFSTLLLHASGPNRSDRTRFTLQVRFGNFLHPVAIEKGWPGSMRDGSFFHEKHPDYVVLPAATDISVTPT